MTSRLYVLGMTSTDENRSSKSDKIRARAELLDWLPAVVLLGLLAVISEFGWFGANSSLRLLWSLLNLIPALLIVRAVVRSVSRADEYQSRRQLRALAVGFGVMMMAIFTAGLLQAADVGDLRQLVQISFIGSIVVWVAVLVASTRTR